VQCFVTTSFERSYTMSMVSPCVVVYNSYARSIVRV